MEKQILDLMEVCAASVKDFIDTVLFMMKEDGFEDDDISNFKKYLLRAYEIHYDSDIGEQGENITKYLDEHYDEEAQALLQEEHEIEKWLKAAGYTDECIGAGFEQVEGHQGRSMDFEYNGNIEKLDVDELAALIAENVIDDRFSVRVFLYDEEEEYKNMFCVEVWLNE